MVDLTDATARIALARDSLAAKLGELRRREARVRTVLSPVRCLTSPWLHVALAVIIGYRLARPDPVRAVVPAASSRRHTIIRAIARASVIAVAQAVARSAVIWLVDHLDSQQRIES
jgi:hypothetical protein